jgi:uncharacterized membrane protein YhaH (DUF805 family)
MNLVKLFFSFRGRANRAGFWLVSVTWFVVCAVLYYAWTASGASEVPLGENPVVDAALILAAVPLIASGFAIGVTRLHDRNKGAWWVLLFYFCPPIIETIASIHDLDLALVVVLMILSWGISIWAFVELGFLRGTSGPNRYGPDPLDDAAKLST